MSKRIEIYYEDKETIELSEVINQMVDNGLAATNLEGGGVTFTADVVLIAGKKEQTMLKEGKISENEWNESIGPLIDRGGLKERKDLASSDFLVIIEDTDGKLYSCNAWTPPDGSPYVDIELYKE